jgi:hypothetical protein
VKWLPSATLYTPCRRSAPHLIAAVSQRQIRLRKRLRVENAQPW